MLRKICIRLSFSTKTSIHYFENLTLVELSEVIEEVEAVMKRK